MAGGLCCCICFDVLVLVMITAFFAFRMFVSYLGLFVCYIVQLTLIFYSRLWLSMAQWKSSWVNNCTSWFKAHVEEKNVFVAIKKDYQNPAWKLFLSFHTFWSLCFLIFLEYSKNIFAAALLWPLQFAARAEQAFSLAATSTTQAHWHNGHYQQNFTDNIIKRCAKQHRERGMQ